MNKKQLANIEKLLMDIPTRLCRNMNNAFVNVILKEFAKDLAQHHFMILKALQAKDKFYVTEIVKMLGITKSQMTSSIDKLIKFGYVKRDYDENDRRKIYISITEEGAEMSNKIQRYMKEQFEMSMGELSQQDLDYLENGLKVLFKFCTLNN